MSKQSPTQRIIAQSCLHKMNDRGTPLRLQVKEPFDKGRNKLGAIIHDPSKANELWELQKAGAVRVRPSRPKKKPKMINAQMSNEWGRV